MGSGGLIQGTHTEFTGSAKSLIEAAKAGKASVQDLTAFLETKVAASTSKAEKAQDSYNKSVARLASELKGNGATAQLNMLVAAVDKLGGVEKLTAAQTDNLTGKVKALAAAGGTVPAQFQHMTQSVSGFGNALGAIKTEGLGQLQGLGSQLGPLGSVLGAIGPMGLAAAAGLGATALAMGAMGKLANDATTWGDKIKDTATATGMTVESVQRLEHAANVAEVPLEQVTGAVIKMQRAMIDSPEKIEALGLSLERIRAMAPERQLVAVADALKLIDDPAQRNAAAVDVFGKSWADLAPLIMDGLGAMDKANVVSAETIDKLDDLKQRSNELGAAWDSLWRNIGASVATSNVVTGAVDSMTLALQRLAAATKERGIVAAIGDEVNSALNDSVMAHLDDDTKAILFRNNIRAIDQRNKATRAAGPPAFAPISETLTAVVPKSREELAADKERNRKLQAAAAKALADLQKTNYNDMLDAMNLYADQVNHEGVFKPDKLSINRKIDFGTQLATGDIPGENLRKYNAAVSDGVPALQKFLDAQSENAKASKNWAQELENVANVAQFLPPIFGQLLGSIAGVGQAMKGMDFKSAAGGFSLTGGAGLGGLLGNFTGGLQIAGLGIKLAKSIGDALGQSESEKIAKDVGRDFGVKISEELAKTIEGEGRGRLDGALLHLREIIDEGGGLGKFGSDKAAGALRDLFSAVDRGTVSLGEAGKVFDDVFGEVAASQISKTTGVASAQIRELVLLAKDFGLESEALRSFMQGQASGAASGLTAGLGTIKASREKGGKGLVDQTAATGISEGVAGSFAAMLAAGTSLPDALRDITPAVQAMREELKAAGLEGGAAFQALEAQVEIVTGEITGPLVAGVNNFATSAVSLFNVNQLTAESFAGITAQIGANIAALEEQGVTGPAAMQALQPDLQKIWELQQATGYAVDATTQNLIDQAVAAGAVGEQHRSAADRMMEASERTAAAVEFLAERFGYLAEAVNSVPDNKTIHVNTEFTSSGNGAPTDGGFAGGEEIPGYATGTGGLVDFGAGTLAELHGFEAVMTKGQLESMVSSTFRAGAMSFSGGSGSPVDMTPVIAEIRMLNEAIARNSQRTVDGMRDAVQQLPQR